VASFGDCCWQTDGKLQAELQRPDGKRYHRESIARARRNLRDRGLISSTRVFMNAKIPGAKFRSARGTTLKTFNWRKAAEKNPFSRRQRRELRIQQSRAARAAGELVPPAAPRYIGVTTAIDPTRTPPTPQLDADMAAVIEQARSAHERRQGMAAGDRAGQAPLRSSAAERPPPE